ncbi:MAG: lytic murein transglycosylase [Deltaproteobacteria bacterium]
MIRLALVLTLVATMSPIVSHADPKDDAFAIWLDAFKTRALTTGISAEVLEQAFAGVSYDPKVIEKDRNQTEFSKPIWEYLTKAVSDDRIRDGAKALKDNAALLAKIENTYGVDAQIVTAIWSLESANGRVRGDFPVFEALSTLAFDARRADLFSAQLMVALQIVQEGDASVAEMKGSWAGAMGHTQFMPISYLAYAQDFDGDGRRNIWGDDPTDALASTAAYLARHGWKHGQPWGYEVTLPKGFDYAQSSEAVRKTPADWKALGIARPDGAALTGDGMASVLLPASAEGVAFLIFDNFHAIEAYNTADAYVIAVGHLGDRMLGGADFVGTWPVDERALTFDEKRELQALLRDVGFDPGSVDGIMGPNTIQAVRAWQAAQKLAADGFASTRLLERLRDSSKVKKP